MKLKNAFNRFVIICLTVCAALVFGYSFFTTIYYNVPDDFDRPLYARENIPLLVVSLVAVLLIFVFLYKKDIFESYKKLSAFGILFVAAYCLMLIFAIRPLPVNDSKQLDDIIQSFVGGDYSTLTEKGGYLFIWPFQLGYVAFGECVTHIFGAGNYLAWDILQMISILITVWLLYRMTWECFEDKIICGIVAILSCGALFFYNYVTYIYGDILSMAPQTAALYAMILFMKRERSKYGIMSGIFIGFAYMLKTNCLIAIIALIMTLLLSRTKNDGVKGGNFAKKLAIVVFMLVVVFGIKNAVNAHYCKVTGLTEIPKGSPAFSHIAMGLQESELQDGWFNGYNYKVFGENDYDVQKTKEAAIENIKETLTDFAKRPLHGGKFFVKKFLSQWADPVCISTHNLELVSRHHDMPTTLGQSLVFGRGSEMIKWIMNVFMTLCYLGVLIYLFTTFTGKKVSDSEMLVLILILGGIVFHEFWEGSSRYAMRYYIYWLPFAACGLKVLIGRFFLHKLK